MSRPKEYRIIMRKNKIKRRKNKILQSLHFNYFIKDKWDEIIHKDQPGYLNKCHYGYLGGGIKTKSKNMYTAKHHKGVHGKAILYSRHDKAQLAHINDEIEDYKNGEI